MRLSERRRPLTAKREDRIAARRDRRLGAGRETPNVKVEMTGADIERGRAIVRGWLTEIDAIALLADGVHLQREGVTVGTVTDPDLLVAVERGLAFGRR